jgi:hypothetical protein
LTQKTTKTKESNKKNPDGINPSVRNAFARLTGKSSSHKLAQQQESNYDSSDDNDDQHDHQHDHQHDDRQPPANKRSLQQRLPRPTENTSKKPPPPTSPRRPKKRSFYSSFVEEEHANPVVTKERSVSKLKNKQKTPSPSSTTIRVNATSISLSDSHDAPNRTLKHKKVVKSERSMVFSSDDDDDYDGFHMTTIMTTTTSGSKSTTTNKIISKNVMDSSSSEDELLMTQQPLLPKHKKAKYSSKPDGPSRDKMDHSKQRRGLPPPPLHTPRSSMLKPRMETSLSSSAAEDSIDSFIVGKKKASKSESVAAAAAAAAAKDSSNPPQSFKRPSEIGALIIEKTEPSRQRKSDIQASSFRSKARREDDLTDSSSDDQAGALAVNNNKNNNKMKLGKNASTPVGRQPRTSGSTTQSVASSQLRHPGIYYAPDSSEDESSNARKKKSKGKSDIPATPAWSTDCDIDSPPPSTFLKNRGGCSSSSKRTPKSDRSIFEFSSQNANVGSLRGRSTTSGIPTHRRGRRGKEKKTKQTQMYPKVRS